MKNLKNYIAVLFFVTLFSVVTMVQEIYASSLEKISDSEEYQEILNMSDEILETANSCYPMLGTFTKDDIKFDEAVKDYIGNDIFESEVLSLDDLNQITEKSHYVWLVPLYSQEDTVWVTLAIQEEVNEERVEGVLTTEQIEKLRENVGKWTITEAAKQSGRVSYKDEIQQTIEQNNSASPQLVAVFGGTPQYRYPMVIVSFGEGDTYIHPLRETEMLAATEGNSENSRETYSDRKNTLYRFEDVQYAASQIEPIPEGEFGNGMLNFNDINAATFQNKTAASVGVSQNIWIIVGILGGAVIIAGITIIYIKKHNRI